MVEENIILECATLTKSYGQLNVIVDLHFSLYEGETVAITGESGCGKTTFLKCINLLELPQNGIISFKGDVYLNNSKVIYEPYEIRQKIGLVFQEYNLFPNLTCLQNITLALKEIKKCKKSDANSIAKNISEKLKIEDILNSYPDSISGGQAQRLALARALVLEPEILLLDEVTSALDKDSTKNIIDIIADIRTITTKNISIIAITHQYEFARDFSNRILKMEKGKLYEY
jgi:polar amino acid transport system ATP-binding protein